MAITESVSRGIVNLLISDLQAYIDDSRIVYEKFRVEPIQLEPRKNIPFVRIALYEDTQSTVESVRGYKANMGEQTYNIDVSVVRAYAGDKANRGELVALDVCDAIVEWSKQANIPDITAEYLYSFDYRTSTRFLRNDNYTSRTLVFVGKRDLFKDQKANIML